MREHIGVVAIDAVHLIQNVGHTQVQDDDDDTDHLRVVILPGVLCKGITDKIAKSFGPADITFLGDRFVESIQKIGFQ